MRLRAKNNFINSSSRVNNRRPAFPLATIRFFQQIDATSQQFTPISQRHQRIYNSESKVHHRPTLPQAKSIISLSSSPQTLVDLISRHKPRQRILLNCRVEHKDLPLLLLSTSTSLSTSYIQDASERRKRPAYAKPKKRAKTAVAAQGTYCSFNHVTYFLN